MGEQKQLAEGTKEQREGVENAKPQPQPSLLCSSVLQQRQVLGLPAGPHTANHHHYILNYYANCINALFVCYVYTFKDNFIIYLACVFHYTTHNLAAANAQRAGGSNTRLPFPSSQATCPLCPCKGQRSK